MICLFSLIFYLFLALESDRTRLKADKRELLHQIEETQKTIDDKEEQLREFLREFESQKKVPANFSNSIKF